MIALLAWRPFLDPVVWVHQWWWVTLPPLILLIAVGYKAVKATSREGYFRGVLVMTLQLHILVLILALALLAILFAIDHA